MRRNSQNSKNGQKDSIASDNPFTILSEDEQHGETLADTIVVSSIEPVLESRAGRPLRPSRKRQQEYSPPAPPPASKRRSQNPIAAVNTATNDPVLQALGRIEAALARSEERAIRAEKRVEELEATVKSLLSTPSRTTEARPDPSPTPSANLNAKAPTYRLPGVNLDLSAAPQLRKDTPGELRNRVDECLQACGLQVKSLGVNVKDKDKIRVFFRGNDHAIAQQEVEQMG